MARIRTIKPEFHADEKLSALPEATHLLAAALLNYADDEGYFNANPNLIRAACCPLREPSVTIQDSLTKLTDIGYIEIGLSPDGRRYGRIPGFLKHQVINRAKPSRISTLDVSWNNHVPITEPSMLEVEWKGSGNGMEQGKEVSAATAAARNESDAELRDWMTWWNMLKSESLVPSGVIVDEPSRGVTTGWKRVRREAGLRKLLADRDAIEREIRASSFCRESWFRLEKLFGGTNRDGELIVQKLLDGGYRGKQTAERVGDGQRCRE
jgi:hypothetical protein